MKKIRAVALCLIRRGDELLLERTEDERTGVTFYRPIGGTVEVGETSKEAVAREVREELGAAISEPRLLFVIENLFEYEGELGHEVDFLYEAELLDSRLYEREEVEGMEGDAPYQAVWTPLDWFRDRPKDAKLVPDGLLYLLLEQKSGRESVVRHIRTR
ncbi:NUDIX hydrolase [Paenibacillus sp. J31TS4]|uniref:NUDIX hydrolase n=1 Tax=Paenibacillus sp. J31TS4 TaxID=2807195 RepID=UPI001B1A84B9|nr:NUDIX domain-containing protein [Paenibacillus sp. J31TS4]GIP39371.1 NUDIX hydrolase [Paenibacillus sp. J31TS4]